MATRSIPAETRETLKLAIPIALTMIGNQLMGIVDTIVVGQYNSADLAGVAAGNGLFWPVAILGTGMILGLEPIISQGHGAGEYKQCDRGLASGLAIGLVFGAVVTPILYLIGEFYHIFGAAPEVVPPARDFLRIIALSFPMMILFNVFQRYWQSFGVVVPITLIMIAANLVNLVADIVLVGGWKFIPAMGAAGAGWATTVCRVFILLAIIGLSVRLWRKRNREVADDQRFVWREACRVDKAMLGKIWRLGVPSSLQMGLEVGAFSLATTLAATLGVIPLAGHHIILTLASFTFMFPLGLSSAAAVRVGNAIGKRDVGAAIFSGWTCKALGVGVMAVFGLIFYFAPEPFIEIFTEDPLVIAQVLAIVPLVAFFQIFDGLQIIGAGSLRGLGNTKFALYSNAIGHYVIGLPIGLGLCFGLDRGVIGLWTGLTAGLLSTALLNTYFWRRFSRTFQIAHET